MALFSIKELQSMKIIRIELEWSRFSLSRNIQVTRTERTNAGGYVIVEWKTKRIHHDWLSF